mmetsp:Transcript_9567/g.24518  ORF Transcript_9567/g.24518 Transcript_9567/m.24518 type:complete len:125 (-) Transcript_9567:55-429(-)
MTPLLALAIANPALRSSALPLRLAIDALRSSALLLRLANEGRRSIPKLFLRFSPSSSMLSDDVLNSLFNSMEGRRQFGPGLADFLRRAPAKDNGPCPIPGRRLDPEDIRLSEDREELRRSSGPE